MSDNPSSGNEQQGASLKDIQVIGGEFSSFSIGNTIQNNYLKQKAEFTELKNLEEEFKSPNFPSPLGVDKRIASLYKCRLLVLCGSHEDKSELALHLAVKLREKLQRNVPIYESISSLDSQSLVLEIRGERTNEAEKNKETIKCFFLPTLQPQNVNYNLDQIYKAAEKGNNYVIATTDVPIDKWTLDKEAKELFCWELHEENIYNPNELADILIQRLSRNKSISDQIELELRKLVVEKFKTVASIGRCVQLLSAQNLQIKTINDAVITAGNGKISLEKWFRSLKSRDQLLALGLSLFDGLFDDQFFAALEKVVKNVWQQRDSSLRALDYCDLENLGNYFEFFEIKAYGSKLNGFKVVNPENYATEIEISRIDIRRTKERQMLFEVAWKSHRRQIITALPEIVQMVKDSVIQEPSSWELYGDSIRCKQLRNVISETLSDIGLVRKSATSAVQDALLQLSTDKAFEVQDVAASAIARWYRYGHNKELFGTLQRFYNIAIQKEGNAQQTEQWQDCIGATVALTISYAAGYDLPNCLSKDLCNWLRELSESKSSLIRTYFGYHTLFYVVPLHLVQLRDMLKEMAYQHTDLNDALARSLALAYTVNPVKVQETLDLWYSECLPNRFDPINAAKLTQRDRLLATVALTYGEIRCDEGFGTLTADEVFKQLSKIFTAKEHPFVYEAAITAICNQLRRDFKEIEPKLQILVADIADNKRSKIIEMLTELYLEQRANLKGGNYEIKVNNRCYQVWADPTNRPKTDVEKAMLRWVKDDIKPVAQQVAIKASVNFVSALEQEEESQIKNIQLEQRGRTKNLISTVLKVFNNPVEIDETQPNLYVYRLVSWLVTRKSEQYRPAILNILPIAFKQNKSHRDAVSFVIGKWRISPDKKIKNISELLKRGLWLSENFGTLALGVGSLGILGVILVMNIIPNIPVQISQFTTNSGTVTALNPTSNSSLTQEEAVDLINKYLKAKKDIFGPNYNSQLVDSFTTGKYYEDITKPEGAIDRLKQKNRYYQYGLQQTEPLGYFSNTENGIQIDVRITEELLLYEKNIYKENQDYSLNYRLTLEQENGVWKISDRVKIQPQDGE